MPVRYETCEVSLITYIFRHAQFEWPTAFKWFSFSSFGHFLFVRPLPHVPGSLALRYQVGMAVLLRDDREPGALSLILCSTQHGVFAVSDARQTHEGTNDGGGRSPKVLFHWY